MQMEKGPHFVSVTRNCNHQNDIFEADGVFILPPSLHQCSVYGYLEVLEATRKGKQSKQGFEITTGNRSRGPAASPCIEGRAVTNYANPRSVINKRADEETNKNPHKDGILKKRLKVKER